MADWFIDASISGGNGTDPASAFPSISSVVWGAGDRAWVRNTHYEFVTNSMFIGPQSFTVINSYSQWGLTVGWPQVGDPFYDERPARGTTVGWDADVPATSCYSLTGNKFPTFAGSCAVTAAGFFLPNGGAVYNMCIQNNATGATVEPWLNNAKSYQRWLDNIVILMNSGSISETWGSKAVCNFGKVTVVLSSADGFSSNWNFHVMHLVVASRSLIANQLFRTQGAASYIGLLEIQTNSLGYLIGRNNTGNVFDDQGEGQFHIGRITGKQPNIGISSVGIDCYTDLMVDDYYGQGPVLSGTLSTQNTRVASINEAACDIGSGAVNALIYQVNSNAAALANISYAMPSMKRPVLRKYFTVVSGTPIQIRVPVYVDSTAVFSLASGQHRGYLAAAGCKPNVGVRSTILTGTPASWTGSLIAGGAAYLWVNTFTPQESGNVPFEILLGWPTQATNGTPVKGQAYFGEPYKV